MLETMISLDTVDKVKNFVHLAHKCPYDVDILSGRYLVDGKSIMGIFSLRLQEPVCVRIHGDNCEDFLEELERTFPQETA